MPARSSVPSRLLRGLAWAALVLAGPLALAQAEVRVTPAEAAVRQGETRTFTAERLDHVPANWAWSVVEGPAGGTIGTHSGEYRAPAQMEKPRAFHVRVVDPNEPGVTATVEVVATCYLVTTVIPSVTQDDLRVPLRALRSDGQVPVWAWESAGPGGKVMAEDGQWWFVPPRVTEPTIVRVRVQDTAAPGADVFTWIRVLPSLVQLRVGAGVTLPLHPGQRCALEASVPEGVAPPEAWTWRVLEPGGGTLEVGAPGRASYGAPRVAVPSTFHVQAAATGTGRLLATLALDIQPTIRLRALPSAHVMAGQQCLLKASAPADGSPAPTWRWKLLDGPPNFEGGLFQGANPSEVHFRAPRVGSPTSYTVEVTDRWHPGDPARIKLLVLPALSGLERGTEAVFQALMPAIMGEDWLAPAPQATLLAGRLGLAPGAPAAAFQGINCIAFMGAVPPGDPRNQAWLVGDRWGLKAIRRPGEVHVYWPVSSEVTALALRGPGPGAPPLVAIATTTGGDSPQGMVSLVRKLFSDSLTPLAGTLAPVPAAARLEVGRGPQVDFGRIQSLAWTPEGALDVVDQREGWTRIRRIAPDGQVTLLTKCWGTYPAVAWDPAHDQVYAVRGNSILSGPRGGPWPTLLGGSGAGYGDFPGGVPPAMLNCLNRPTGLQLLGRQLFIADTGNQAIRVYNLDTRVLQTLAGHPEEKRPRLGPLGFACPDRPRQDCAALAEPGVFAINDAGACVVAQDEGLVLLDLSALVEAPRATGYAVPMEEVSGADGDAAPAAAAAAGPGPAALPAPAPAAAAAPSAAGPAQGGSPDRKRSAPGALEEPDRKPPQPSPQDPAPGPD